MDYILNWIDTNSLIIAKNTSFINDLIEWRRSIENDLDDHVKNIADEYIANYDWSQVPEFDAKADKVENAVLGHLASLGANGNLQDSGYEASNFANANHSHNGINLGENVANHILIEETGSIGRFHVQLWDGQEEEPVFSNYITGAMLDNTFFPDTTPNSDSDKLITSGAVYAELQGKAPTTHSHSQIQGQRTATYVMCEEEEGTGSILISVEDAQEGDNNTEITYNNLPNLKRALQNPDEQPESESNNLITSGAVYEALAGKMDKILTLRIDVDTSDNDYPMTTEADSLLSAFVNNVSVGTYVPVPVELHTQNAPLGTILGIARWLEVQNGHDVEIRIGRLLFSTYRQEDGQQHWGDFTDWTKSPSQDIEDYFL